jgi:hypothetical protein
MSRVDRVKAVAVEQWRRGGGVDVSARLSGDGFDASWKLADSQLV